MILKTVILFLLFIAALGLVAGPGFRRLLARALGLPVPPKRIGGMRPRGRRGRRRDDG